MRKAKGLNGDLDRLPTLDVASNVPPLQGGEILGVTCSWAFSPSYHITGFQPERRTCVQGLRTESRIHITDFQPERRTRVLGFQPERRIHITGLQPKRRTRVMDFRTASWIRIAGFQPAVLSGPKARNVIARPEGPGYRSPQINQAL